mmetsp:Transcript_35492/g.84043  ORF Transcript_35492/g.84043 Transcript_35492/m.84043 type:complete len:270 (+) Transcript_35492:1230-2039(+)
MRDAGRGRECAPRRPLSLRAPTARGGLPGRRHVERPVLYNCKSSAHFAQRCDGRGHVPLLADGSGRGRVDAPHRLRSPLRLLGLPGQLVQVQDGSASNRIDVHVPLGSHLRAFPAPLLRHRRQALPRLLVQGEPGGSVPDSRRAAPLLMGQLSLSSQDCGVGAARRARQERRRLRRRLGQAKQRPRAPPLAPGLAGDAIHARALLEALRRKLHPTSGDFHPSPAPRRLEWKRASAARAGRAARLARCCLPLAPRLGRRRLGPQARARPV